MMLLRSTVGGLLLLMTVVAIGGGGFLIGLEADSPPGEEIRTELEEGKQDAMAEYDDGFRSGLVGALYSAFIPLAETSAQLGYQNRNWISPFWANGVLNGVVFGMAVAVVYSGLTRMPGVMGS